MFGPVGLTGRWGLVCGMGPPVFEGGSLLVFCSCLTFGLSSSWLTFGSVLLGLDFYGLWPFGGFGEKIKMGGLFLNYTIHCNRCVNANRV